VKAKIANGLPKNQTSSLVFKWVSDKVSWFCQVLISLFFVLELHIKSEGNFTWIYYVSRSK